MEDYIKLSEYLENDSQNLIVKCRKSPLMGIVVLVVGVAMIVLGVKCCSAELAQMSLLTVGAMAALVGLSMVVLNMCGHGCNYIYKPTGAKMKHYSRYINADDRRACQECLLSGKMSLIGKVRKETSTGTRLQAYVSTDGGYALLQLEEYIPHDFVPMTPVVAVVPEEVESVQRFFKD